LLETGAVTLRKSCLIVDDSVVARRFARRILEALSFSIREAGDGERALVACQRRMPDLILLDWNMPVMDGIEFLRRLRATRAGTGPVVLFCTAETEPDRIASVIEAGANEYIMKPFDADILASKLVLEGLL
jgi:two-component system, chemotaxis family, chemotaxis protein CheY